MATDDKLTEFDEKLYKYLVDNDFTVEPWNTPKAAKKFGVSEDKIYESLSRLAKHKKNNVWIYYNKGSVRIAAE